MVTPAAESVDFPLSLSKGASFDVIQSLQRLIIDREFCLLCSSVNAKISYPSSLQNRYRSFDNERQFQVANFKLNQFFDQFPLPI